MSEHTAITWCDSTFNPWVGCTKVSPACDHCYAERFMDHRLHRVQWGAGQPRQRTIEANWRLPLAWNKRAFVECPQCGWRGEWEQANVRAGCCPRCNHLPRTYKLARRRVFCASLADVFDNEVAESWRLDLFWLIRKTPDLDWLLLTKRIGNARSMLAAAVCQLDPAGEWPVPLPNVWLGITVVNQAEADRDIPKLLAAPVAKRFLSIEPMLGPVSLRWLAAWPENAPNRAQSPTGLTDHLDGLRRLDWVICGGESGPHARPMHPDWVRSLRDQCAAAGVPFHFKQWGEWAPGRRVGATDSHRWPIEANEPDGGVWSGRIGVRRAGRLLDGIEHNGDPA